MPSAEDVNAAPAAAVAETSNAAPAAAAETNNAPPAAAAETTAETTNAPPAAPLPAVAEVVPAGASATAAPPSRAEGSPTLFGTDEDVDEAKDEDEAQDEDEAPADPKPTLPAKSIKVMFADLCKYDVADLTPAKMYNPHDEEQKPITLTAMGLGVEGFPDVEKDEDIIKATSRNKGSLFNKSDIVPSSRNAKPYLYKEIIRRKIIDGTPSQNHPKVGNWPVKKSVEWLQKNPPCGIEHEQILEFWNILIDRIRSHYLDNSGSTWAITLRHVRQWEALLHSSLINDFKRRHHQIPVHVLDANNSSKKPLSFWEKVAKPITPIKCSGPGTSL